MVTSGSIANNKSISHYLSLLRPKHWIKNSFIFLPLFFSGEVFNMQKLLLCFAGFIAFSFIASAVYVINDYMDIEADKKHPVKCARPLASGAVSKKAAIALFISCVVLGIAIAALVKDKFLFVLMLYFIMNLGYSLGLKNISVLDIVLVAMGFVLRIKAGGVIAVIGISQWLMIMVFLLAMFMAIAKRRDDVLIKLDSGLDMRKAIKGYNLEFLNAMLSLFTGIIIIAYIMYTISPEVMQHWNTYRLYYTSLFVIVGLMRYLQITFIEKDSGSPTDLLYKDKFLQITLVLWIISFYLIIYLPDISIFK
ncbi:UbiA prenyltransferase family protein [Parafilimonas terrae]|uniref:4-hydroxybenzoate polyprenyltransferase n=1 Tax=Parafilimonas terrae TaxID=1465490 RepID=A0A1I5UJ67_9BACT|nr:UbiA prenyltransferase family protein [Parafilimonas terrae]SFP94666.1 4-hydroxybenzoate polyprenyltransferase [Parafilimonas terrae]